MIKRFIHDLGPLLVVLIFAGAVWLLFRELRHYHFHEIRQSLAEIPIWRLLLAAGLTALNYVILVGYGCSLRTLRARNCPIIRNWT